MTQGDAQPLRLLALNWRCQRHEQAGGGELNLFEQAERWAGAGHQVTVLTSDPGRGRAPHATEVIRGVTVRRRGGRFAVYAATALHLLRYGHRYDAILDVSNGIPFFTPLLTRTPSVLLIHHVHGEQWRSEFGAGPVAALGQWLEQRAVPWLYRRRAVVAVSPTTQEALLQLGYRPDQLQVIYNGVTLPEARPDDAPSASAQRVLYLGRVRRYKRVDLLVRAIAALRERFPAIHLDIAGDGDARAGLEVLVRELGLEAHVTLHGFVSEAQKDALLRAATVFATPSMHEGWGLSVIEANAWGCPAVAYDVPGLRVAIRHGETGLLAQTDEEFAGAIGLLLSNPGLRREYSQRASAWAARFDWDTAAQSTLRLLGQAVKPSRRRTG